MYRFGGTQGTLGTLWYLRDLRYLWYLERKRQELGRANLLQYYGTNRTLRYIVESALALNDFTKPLGMSVALDDNIPEPTRQEHSDQNTSVPENYDKYKIRYRELVVGGWETSYS